MLRLEKMLRSVVQGTTAYQTVAHQENESRQLLTKKIKADSCSPKKLKQTVAHQEIESRQ